MILPFLINALCIVGIHEATREGMIGERIASALRYILGAFWSKPLTECLTCMASVWGTVGFFLQDYPLWAWPVYVLAMAGTMATYGNILYRE